jgi:hypothetical protein
MSAACAAGTHQHQAKLASLRLGEPHLAGASGAAVLLSGLPLTVVPLRWPHSTGKREERPMSAKFVMFTNAATKEPILVNPDHVCSALPVPGTIGSSCSWVGNVMSTWRATLNPFGRSWRRNASSASQSAAPSRAALDAP